MPDINCALGISQLKKLDKYIFARKKISKFYDKLFIDKTKFKTPEKIKNTENSFHLYPLLINLKKLKTKEKIIKQFLQRNIKLQVHYIPVNTQPYFRKKYKYDKTKYKNSRYFFKRCVSLPIYYDLKKNQLRKIKIACKEIFGLN